MNRSVIVSVVFLVLVGLCVSRVKYEVVFLRNKLKEIDRKIEKYQDDIRVYNAEWSYLNDPKRLKRLAMKYLPNLRPTENAQIISFDAFMASDFEKAFTQNIAPIIEQHSKRRAIDASKAFGSFLDEAVGRNGGVTQNG